VRFADRLLRQGHLSEDALAAAIVTGERPDHLDHCAACSARALELSRWLDDLRLDAVSAADAAFPVERLAVQHAQILRKIEQVEEPVRVLEFPKTTARARAVSPLRRVSPGWLGVAAAAGLAVGVVGGHFSAHFNGVAVPTTESTDAVPGSLAPEPQPTGRPGGTLLFDLDLEDAAPAALRDMDAYTPRLIPTSQIASAR
jgi:hypothetical protein